jgi:hypothetical protein
VKAAAHPPEPRPTQQTMKYSASSPSGLLPAFVRGCGYSLRTWREKPSSGLARPAKPGRRSAVRVIDAHGQHREGGRLHAGRASATIAHAAWLTPDTGGSAFVSDGCCCLGSESVALVRLADHVADLARAYRASLQKPSRSSTDAALVRRVGLGRQVRVEPGGGSPNAIALPTIAVMPLRTPRTAPTCGNATTFW